MRFSRFARRAAATSLFAIFLVLVAGTMPGCGNSGSTGVLSGGSTLSSGEITTVAGTSFPGYAGDTGVATSAELNFPHKVVLDSSGNIYIADTGNNVIRLVTASTGDISTFAGTGTAGYSGDSGAATSAELNFPIGLALDSSGNLYVADSGNNVVRKIDTSGNISTVVGTYPGTAGYSGDGFPATSAKLNAPQGIALDGSGNLYIADTGNNVIRKVTSGTISTVAGTGTAGYSGDGGPATSAKLDLPTDVAVDSSGNFYIADAANELVRKVSGGTIAIFAGKQGIASYTGDKGAATSATLNGPRGVTLDSSGNLYIADYGNNVVRKVSSGNITTVAGTGLPGYTGDNGAATAAEMVTPYSVSFDSLGDMYIADSGNNVIRRVQK